jgi:hypothetical protein
VQQKPAADLAKDQGAESAEGHRSGSQQYRPNTSALSSVLEGHGRSNARADAREREAAAHKLRQLNEGAVVRDEVRRCG